MVYKLIGYDLREWCFPIAEIWPRDRRELYLLDVDVEKPLSVDTIVWPSLFDTGQGAGLYQKQRDASGISEIQVPKWFSPDNALWINLEEMIRYKEYHLPDVTCEYRIIAITLHREQESDLEMPPYVAGSFAPDETWRLLGYDVADAFQLSGLSNCGLLTGEVGFLSSQWRSFLNSNHLFDDLDAGYAFQHTTDERISEHRPFYVYGIWSKFT